MNTSLGSVHYFILLALVDKPLHGLAIREQIIGDTLGMYLRDSTLYTSLKNLLNTELISEYSHDGYRRVYELTDKGRRVLEQEARQYKRAAGLAAQRLKFHL